MKKLISILVLIIIIFFVIQMCVTFFTNSYIKKYTIVNGNEKFNVTEKYYSKDGDIYSVSIQNDNINFNYAFENTFNKQKKVIKSIEYIKSEEDFCIYPVLIDNNGSYIECLKDGQLFTGYSYPNVDFINSFKQELISKGYNFDVVNDLEHVENYGNTKLYYNNLSINDAVILWKYKGINIFKKTKYHDASVLNFDKYENKLGVLDNNYYVIPCYTSSRVLEFSSVFVINVNRYKVDKLDLGYTLSSSTYLNGVVDGKIYYTDPSNLIQIEINPSTNNVRLVGSKDISAQAYNGEWYDMNIYDFRSSEILFKDDSLLKDFSYIDFERGNNSFYYYTSNGDVYQLSLADINNPILLFNARGLNNFNVVGTDIYYVISDTLYKFNLRNGSIPVMVNSDLKYNSKNRIDIYRK